MLLSRERQPEPLRHASSPLVAMLNKRGMRQPRRLDCPISHGRQRNGRWNWALCWCRCLDVATFRVCPAKPVVGQPPVAVAMAPLGLPVAMRLLPARGVAGWRGIGCVLAATVDGYGQCLSVSAEPLRSWVARFRGWLFGPRVETHRVLGCLTRLTRHQRWWCRRQAPSHVRQVGTPQHYYSMDA